MLMPNKDDMFWFASLFAMGVLLATAVSVYAFEKGALIYAVKISASPAVYEVREASATSSRGEYLIREAVYSDVCYGVFDGFDRVEIPCEVYSSLESSSLKYEDISR